VACPRTRLSWPDREAAEKSGRPARFVLGRGRELVPQPHVGEDLRNLTMPISPWGERWWKTRELREHGSVAESPELEATSSACPSPQPIFTTATYAAQTSTAATVRHERVVRVVSRARVAPAWDLTRARPRSHRSAPCLLAWRSPCVAIAVPPVGDALDYARRSEWRARRGPLFLMTRCSGAVRTAAAWPASSPNASRAQAGNVLARAREPPRAIAPERRTAVGSSWPG